MPEEGVPLQRLFAVAVALHPLQAEPELVHPHAAAPVNIAPNAGFVNAAVPSGTNVLNSLASSITEMTSSACA